MTHLPEAAAVDIHPSNAGYGMLDLGGFALLPSLPVLNIAARIIQRHWRRTEARRRLRHRRNSREGEGPQQVPAGGDDPHHMQQEHADRRPLETRHTHPMRSERRREAEPRRQQRHGGHHAAADVSVFVDPSVRHSPTRLSAFDGHHFAAAAAAGAGERIEGREQPRFVSGGPQQLSRPPKGGPPAGRTSKRGPPEAELNMCGWEGLASSSQPTEDSATAAATKHLAAAQGEEEILRPEEGEGEANEELGPHGALGSLDATGHPEGPGGTGCPVGAGGPEEGSVCSDAEFDALLQEGDTQDRLGRGMEDMCLPWTEGSASGGA
ncbi:uncharacterized protein EMH_0097370 [Eimeria mitis]|uniref:Uncharacterized protein n=1 Tax=Eimeria mitis TaxID=44415 RepID=U6KFR9_9EIME|nr:uncharacterized protein EMH_0097370 [Eimeria mitis]CDJ36845.1 hypothetical protein, conserved [Eimeria mitis]